MSQFITKGSFLVGKRILIFVDKRNFVDTWSASAASAAGRCPRAAAWGRSRRGRGPRSCPHTAPRSSSPPRTAASWPRAGPASPPRGYTPWTGSRSASLCLCLFISGGKSGSLWAAQGSIMVQCCCRVSVSSLDWSDSEVLRHILTQQTQSFRYFLFSAHGETPLSPCLHLIQ